jgi:hypothetical protein
MNIPRKRRYPMRPKPRKFSDGLKFKITPDPTRLHAALSAAIAETQERHQPTVGLAAKLIAARHGKRAAHAWTTNLTPTPPIDAQRPSPGPRLPNPGSQEETDRVPRWKRK